jgi:hypothetical protein
MGNGMGQERQLTKSKTTMNTEPTIEPLPPGTTTCNGNECKSRAFEWEQIHGMRMVRMIDGHEVYSVRCPKCGNHQTVLKANP